MKAELKRLDIPCRIVNGIKKRIRRARIESNFRARKKPMRKPFVAGRTIDSSKPKIIIIGAGIAGLSAGYELLRLGYGVSVLEAGAQFGGRASAVRRPFSEGLFVDAGGFRFPADHFRVREYLSELGLNYTPFYSDQGDMLVYLNGKFFRRKLGERLRPGWISRPLTAEESWMFDQENEVEMFRVRGGVDTFAEALGERISEQVTLQAEVR